MWHSYADKEVYSYKENGSHCLENNETHQSLSYEILACRYVLKEGKKGGSFIQNLGDIELKPIRGTIHHTNDESCIFPFLFCWGRLW